MEKESEKYLRVIEAEVRILCSFSSSLCELYQDIPHSEFHIQYL